jgi:hypothetical protein
MSETEIPGRPRVIALGLSPSPTQINMRRRAAVSLGPSDAVFGCRSLADTPRASAGDPTRARTRARCHSSDLAVDGDRQGRADLAHSGVSKPAESLDEDAERDALD